MSYMDSLRYLYSLADFERGQYLSWDLDFSTGAKQIRVTRTAGGVSVCPRTWRPAARYTTMALLARDLRTTAIRGSVMWPTVVPP